MEEKNLENIVEQPSTGCVQWGVSEQGAINILPLEQYVSLFSSRYKKEEAFRNIVHDYLGLSRWNRIKLAFGKKLFKARYAKKTDAMITQYAHKIRDRLELAVQAQKELAELKKAEVEVKKTEVMVQEVAKSQQEIEWEYQKAFAEESARKDGAEKLFKEQVTAEQARRVEEEVAIKKRTNAQEIVKETLKVHLSNSSFVKTDTNGKLAFDDAKMMARLEEIFLEEIVQGIEREDGTGFFSKTQVAFGGVIAYWAALEELAELPCVDWVQSAIFSRIKGYKVPTFPYLISGKSEEKGKSSIDTAISIDRSGSMRDNGRMEVATKTGLALDALMRKLNPRNNTYLSGYNSELSPLTPKELLNLRPDGGTRTDLALKWLHETLKDKGPSIAYLVTDGRPDDAAEAEKQAAKFKDSLIMLRLFLIDGDNISENIIRGIGRSAGPKTKVVPVKNYQLAGGVIKDISNVFREMYDIARF